MHNPLKEDQVYYYMPDNFRQRKLKSYLNQHDEQVRLTSILYKPKIAPLLKRIFDDLLAFLKRENIALNESVEQSELFGELLEGKVSIPFAENIQSLKDMHLLYDKLIAWLMEYYNINFIMMDGAYTFDFFTELNARETFYGSIWVTKESIEFTHSITIRDIRLLVETIAKNVYADPEAFYFDPIRCVIGSNLPSKLYRFGNGDFRVAFGVRNHAVETSMMLHGDEKIQAPIFMSLLELQDRIDAVQSIQHLL